ncbi:MAG: CPBP family intramembrane glutamic endopeptidase [Actinomycetales bacterium]
MTLVPELAAHPALGSTSTTAPDARVISRRSGYRRRDTKASGSADRSGGQRRSSGAGVAVLAVGMTVGPWSVWFSAIAQDRGLLTWRLPQGLAIWSIVPGLLTALLVVGGRLAVADVARRLLRWRVRPAVAAAALLLPPAVAAATLGVADLVGVPVKLGASLSGPAALVYFGYGIGLWLLTEEAGWRGAILPRLQQRLSPLAASLVLGVIWAGWHVPLLLAPGERDSGLPLLPFAVLVVAASVLITALVNAARGSVLVAAVFHSSFDAVFAWTGVVGGDHRLIDLAALVMSITAVLIAPRLLTRQEI